ncbi:hypothetical protein IMCC1989_2209 [gamma proteobacterium IMCC1989]|nr:hypothetical protein IMCC1989_2209 [gamma proteobacterium IMCC1989]
MKQYQLAQLNIAKLSHPIDSPELADFVANLDRINALAEESDGFVWRHTTEVGDTLEKELFGEDYIVNMSVWDNNESLHHYVYFTAHVEIMSRKKEWFEKVSESHMVQWWVSAGHKPSLQEAKDKLDQLRENGSTPLAFTFKKAFASPE